MGNKRKVLTGSLLAAAIALVGGYEGLRTHAYRDATGIPTICFGETRGVHMGDRKTVAQCREMLGDSLREFSRKIDACLPNSARIPDKSYEAFLSLAYNIGAGGFCRSSVARQINRGNLKLACEYISLYDRAGGRYNQGLANRRAQEKKLCLEGLE